MKQTPETQAGPVDLPAKGIDLRAELQALQRERVRQAMERAGGDAAKAARLLRLPLLDFMRLAARAAESASKRGRRPDLDARIVPRVSGAVEFISRAAIVRYAAEGVDVREIARRLGCNRYLAEKAVREWREGEIVKLDAEHYSPKEIALRLRIALADVRTVLSRGQRAAQPAE
jgi:DNA-binding CsgD family transcriptional regulator